MKVWDFLVGSLARPITVVAKTREEAVGKCRSAADRAAEKRGDECPVAWDLHLVREYPHYTFREQRRKIKEAFPALFSGRPWAVGTARDIAEHLPEGVTITSFKRVAKFHTSRSEYFASLARGEERVTFDGKDAGKPTPEDVAYAKGLIAGFAAARKIYLNRNPRKEILTKLVVEIDPASEIDPQKIADEVIHWMKNRKDGDAVAFDGFPEEGGTQTVDEFITGMTDERKTELRQQVLADIEAGKFEDITDLED